MDRFLGQLATGVADPVGERDALVGRAEQMQDGATTLGDERLCERASPDAQRSVDETVPVARREPIQQVSRQ